MGPALAEGAGRRDGGRRAVPPAPLRAGAGLGAAGKWRGSPHQRGRAPRSRSRGAEAADSRPLPGRLLHIRLRARRDRRRHVSGGPRPQARPSAVRGPQRRDARVRLARLPEFPALSRARTGARRRRDPRRLERPQPRPPDHEPPGATRPGRLAGTLRGCSASGRRPPPGSWGTRPPRSTRRGNARGSPGCRHPPADCRDRRLRGRAGSSKRSSASAGPIGPSRSS